MLHFSEELKSLHAQVGQKKHLETLLANLQLQRDELVHKVNELEKMKLSEQKDVERLEGRSLASFFYNVVGKMDERLDKERREAYAAAVKYDVAVQELESIEFDIEKSMAELRNLQAAEEKYNQLLQKKKEELKLSGSTVAAEILSLEVDILKKENEKREIEEALREGVRALGVLDDVKSTLKSADGYATWDMLGGGLFVDMMKHDELDKAQRQIESFQIQLRRYKTELADVTIRTNLQVNFTGFEKFADFFFDGLFMDWEIKDQIGNSKRQVEEIGFQIESVQERLRSMMKATEESQKRQREKIEELIVQA